MRRAVLLAVGMLSVGAAACGDSSQPETDPSKALAYMPPEPALLAILDTDVDGDQVAGFEDTVGDGNELGDVENLLQEALEGSEISYEEDVEPLLGGPLVVAIEDERAISGAESTGIVAALVVGDEERARDTLEKIPESDEISHVGDEVVVIAENPDVLARARAHADGDEGLDPDIVEGALRGLPDDALLKLYADLDDGVLQLPELSRLTRMPWFDTLLTLGAAISFDGQTMHADALLSTDHASDDDLPLASDTSEVPEIVRRDGWVSGANLDQSRATVFLLRTVRAAFPDSRFVRDVATVERERKIDFEREFLRQFDGPSQSLLSPDGRFAARSSVRDPARLAATLEKIAPDLGRLVEDLQGLRSGGLSALLLLAPDAPAATSVLDSAGIEVEPLGSDLYRMTGLVGPGPDEIVFGLIGDVFVVAEDETAARAIAMAPTEPFEGPDGPAVAHASGDVLQRLGTDFLGIGATGRLAGDVNASLSAAEDGLRARLVAEYGD